MLTRPIICASFRKNAALFDYKRRVFDVITDYFEHLMVQFNAAYAVGSVWI